MPKFRVTSPEGKTYEVNAPDGATQDDAIAYIQKNHVEPLAPPQVPIEGQNPAAAAVRQDQNPTAPHTFGEKFGMGAGDVGRGVVQGAVRLAPLFNPGDERTSSMSNQAAQFVDAEIANREGRWQDERRRSVDAQGNRDTGTEWTRALGAGVTAAPVSAVLPEVGAAASLPRIMGINALQGGALAGLAPVADTRGGYARAKLGQMTEGAGIGGLTGGALGVSGRVISPQTDPNVRYLMDRGVTPTPGQTLGRTAATMEEKLSIIPFAGDAIKMGQRRAIDDYNRAVYNEVLAPIGHTYQGPIGHEGVRAIGDAISAQYEALLPNLNFQVDRQFASEVQNINNMAQNLTPEARNQFNRIIQNEVMSRMPQGAMDGPTFKNLEEQLGRYVRQLSAGNANERLTGDALSEVVDSLRSGLDRNNPQYIGQLGNINDAWSRLTTLERAAANSTKNEGVFTPEVFLNAIKANDSRVRKRGVGRGEGNMQELANAGNQVLGRTYPDSGTAGRAMAGGLALTGGAGLAINPVAAAATGLGMLAYTPQGQTAANYLFARRPRQAPQIARGVRALAPAATAGLIFGQGGQ